MRNAAATARSTRHLWLLVAALVLGAAALLLALQRGPRAFIEPVAIDGGRPQLINFGRGTCLQCTRMKPVMEAAAAALPGRFDLCVLSLGKRENDLLDDCSNPHSRPVIVLLDGDGGELWRHEGYVSFAELSSAVEERLGPGASPGTCAPEKARCEP